MFRLRRISVVLLFTIAAIMPLPVCAQGADDVVSLNNQLVRLYDHGKYKEATVIAEKLLALVERKLGKEHPRTLTSVNNLAML